MTPLREILHRDVLDVWSAVRPFIDRVVDRCGDTTTEYILGRIVDGDYQLWVGGDFEYVGVTRLEYFEAVDKLAVLVMYLAGDGADRWAMDALDQLEAWAMSQGATEIRIIGRPGWERVFKNAGYRKSQTTITKSVGDMQ